MIDTRFSVSIQIMMTLGHKSNELVSSDTLAKVLKTNPTFVRKIVSRLVAADLIKSYRGKGGGIELAKHPSDISLNDIYLASTDEKRFINVHKKPISKACDVSRCIDSVLDEVVCGIEKSNQSYLSKKLLSDLIKKV
jgi:Rrf2 family protein